MRQGSKVKENRFSPSAMGLYLSGNYLNSNNKGELRDGETSSSGPGQTRQGDEDATKQ